MFVLFAVESVVVWYVCGLMDEIDTKVVTLTIGRRVARHIQPCGVLFVVMMM